MKTGNAVLRGLAVALSAGALSASAITQEEWEADPSLIPSATAESAFYVVEPSPIAGEQTVTLSSASAIDSFPAKRVWFANFQTAMRTFFRGFVLLFR